MFRPTIYLVVIHVRVARYPLDICGSKPCAAVLVDRPY